MGVRQCDISIPRADSHNSSPLQKSRGSLYFSISFTLREVGSQIAQLPKGLFVCPQRRILRQETLMKKTEWTREILTTWPSYEYVKQKESAGWRLAAVEWQRETEAEPPREAPEGSRFGEEIPFGTRIANDCLHLEENPSEMEILNCLAEMIVLDLSYPRMADALNRREFRTREGKPWTPLAVFKLTPRLIEVAPRILSGAEWETRKKQLSRVAWNS
jgi:hypothetical protein